jgi:hypothetical protein
MEIQLKQDSLEAIRERRMSERAFPVRSIGSVHVLTQGELAHHAQTWCAVEDDVTWLVRLRLRIFQKSSYGKLKKKEKWR